MTKTGSAPAAGGVNVLGYHHVDSGLGVAARSIVDSLRAAGVEVTQVEVTATDSPQRRPPKPTSGPLHPTTIAVVTALQLPDVMAQHPDLAAATELLVGYWFWELATIPPAHQRAIEMVDRIWAPTRFVADAYGAATDVPVELQPIHIPKPQPADKTMTDFGVNASTVFVTTFDHFSVVERKNPFAAITAFQSAFPDGDDVALIVKSLNGRRREESHERVLRASKHDERIRVIDTYLGEHDHAALIASASCLVSLHRSEGLGLHLADAMWLGTPVLASRYSGNLDLMDDECAALVDVTMVPVRNGEGAYPDDAEWAEPSVEQAAEWMVRLANEPELRGWLSSQARTRISTQPPPHEVGARMIAALAGAQAVGDQGGPLTSGLRRLARGATAPVRNYFNNHFEMAKEEVRLQAHVIVGHQATSMAQVAAGGSRHQEHAVADLANVVGEISVHQARLLSGLREEVRALQAELAELRRDVNALTDAVVRIAERDDG